MRLLFIYISLCSSTSLASHYWSNPNINCVLDVEHFVAQEIHALQCSEMNLEDCFKQGEKGLEIFINDLNLQYEQRCDD